MDLELKNKTALVSGSSKGIGLSIATCLHNEGCNVIEKCDSEKIFEKLILNLLTLIKIHLNI